MVVSHRTLPLLFRGPHDTVYALCSIFAFFVLRRIADHSACILIHAPYVHTHCTYTHTHTPYCALTSRTPYSVLHVHIRPGYSSSVDTHSHRHRRIRGTYTHIHIHTHHTHITYTRPHPHIHTYSVPTWTRTLSAWCAAA